MQAAVNVWSIDSPTHAYPEMTFSDVTRIICSSFTQNRVISAGIIAAYGFQHPLMIQNLQSLAAGQLKQLLLSTEWEPGQSVGEYFESVFQVHFVAVADSLCTNFCTCTIASTSVEQVFTIARNIVHANNTEITNSNKLLYNTTVKSFIKRKMSNGGFRRKNLNGKNIYRTLRNQETRQVFNRHLWEKAKGLDGNKKFKTSRIQLRGSGKKDMQVLASLPHCAKEALSNRRKEGAAITGIMIANQVSGFDISRRNDSVVFPVSLEDEKRNVIKKYKVKELQNMLKARGCSVAGLKKPQLVDALIPLWDNDAVEQGANVNTPTEGEEEDAEGED